MKMRPVTFAAGIALLLLVISCQKKITDSPGKNSLPNSSEQLAEDPVTPLDNLVPLPSWGRRISLSSLNAPGYTPIPIIMVHGLGGFGPGEMLGFNYWGGIDNIPQYLTSSGYPAFAAKVGPFSSNWDRAVELYYYIKGGYVDYGEFHSSRFGHDRKKSRYYPGIYPQWDAAHPIHLLGHSMGGITVRKLLTLLEKGDATEKQDPTHAGLFDGGRVGWVRSITTVSTPHNGATLTYELLPDWTPFVRNLVTTAAALAGADVNIKGIYDFSLEQWGLEQQPDESFASYAARVGNSRIWTTNDYSGFDVTPESAIDESLVDLDSKNVYYFSVTTKATNKGLLTGWEYPRLDMFPLLIPVAYPWPVVMGLGNYTQNKPGK